jgi:hypothetical protein
MTETQWLENPEPLALADWLFFDALGSDRKLRLFSVACSRSVVGHLRQFAPQATRLLDVTEAFADGLIGAEGLTEHRKALVDQWRAYDDDLFRRYQENQGDIGSDVDVSFWFVSQLAVASVFFGTGFAEERDNPESRHRERDFYRGPDPRSFPFAAAAEAAEAAVFAVEEDSDTARERARQGVKSFQRHLLRDIFGNPFRHVAVDPLWLTSAQVVTVAQAAYDERILPSGQLDLARLMMLADALEQAGASGELVSHLRLRGPHVRGCWALDLILSKS